VANMDVRCLKTGVAAVIGDTAEEKIILIAGRIGDVIAIVVATITTGMMKAVENVAGEDGKTNLLIDTPYPLKISAGMAYLLEFFPVTRVS
jgi:hypothetical protein